MKYTIGVKLGVNRLTAGVVDKNGRLIRKDSMPTPKGEPYQKIVADIAVLVERILMAETISLKDVRYIGIGCPGLPDTERGLIVRNYTLNFNNTPLRQELQQHINLPVYIENDANCAALAENVIGAAEDVDNSITIRLGNGIGGGIILRGEIYSGFNHAGGELGHMVIGMNGEPCTCGRKGCWEAYASGAALIRQTREAAQKNPQSMIHGFVGGDLNKITELTAYEAYKAGDDVGKAVFLQYLEYVAEGLVNVIHVIMPKAIVIGGELSKLGDSLLKPLKVLMLERIYSRHVEMPELRVAQLGSAGVMLGAAMLENYKEIIARM